jgi:hypothetical protein
VVGSGGGGAGPGESAVVPGEAAFGGADPQHRHVCGARDRVAVERNRFEGVAGQGKAADLGGAGVEHVEQHALRRLGLDRLTVAQLRPLTLNAR